MDKEKFENDFNDYKDKLSSKLDENTVALMLHAYCMGYCQLSSELNDEFDSYIDLNPVLDKISSLSSVVNKNFE